MPKNVRSLKTRMFLYVESTCLSCLQSELSLEVVLSCMNYFNTQCHYGIGLSEETKVKNGNVKTLQKRAPVGAIRQII